MSLVAELQRRRVFRALVGYGIAAFAVLQIIERIMHGLHWPDAVLSYVVAALALGFPLVVSLAWIFDVNQGRIERAAPAAQLRGARLAAVLVGIGLLAAAPGSVWYFYVRGIYEPASANAQPAPSIAVLPFVNLSSDKEQEYFSDGIAEEILNALAQVDGLRVIGRTSSFSLKGKNEDLRAIGEKLSAANLLEGSVRKAGSRVRITAQLIDASVGSHLWSQEFDRDLTDVFAVQDEIARAVVAALKLKLLPAQAAAIGEQRTTNSEAHEQYLLGRHFYDRGSSEGYGRAVQSLARRGTSASLSCWRPLCGGAGRLSVVEQWVLSQDGRCALGAPAPPPGRGAARSRQIAGRSDRGSGGLPDRADLCLAQRGRSGFRVAGDRVSEPRRRAGVSQIRPFLRNIRSDPRYASLLAKMKLPPD